MNREEEIKYIQEWLKDEYALTAGDRAALNAAVEALNYLEKNEKWIDLLNIFAESCDFDVNKIIWNAQEWIPCSERLPSEFSDDERVLATTDVDVDGLGVILMPVYDVKSWYLKGYITAWMTLPEPYKAESEDKE